MSSPIFQIIITALEHLRIVSHGAFVGSSMLVYDYFLTLTDEMTLIWPAPWSLMKVLFLVTRYMPFADVAIFIRYHLQPHPNARECYDLYVISSWLFYVGTSLAELILTLRTWAVWNRDWRLSIFLPLFFATYIGCTAAFIVMFIRSTAFMPVPTPAMLGCIAIKGSHILSMCWTMLLIYEGGIFILMLVKGIRTYRNGGSSELFRVVYRDGLLYYLYIFAFSLANVIVVATVPPDVQVVLVPAERVIHPILACRVILDIKNQVANHNSVNTYPRAPQAKKILLQNGTSSSELGGVSSSTYI